MLSLFRSKSRFIWEVTVLVCTLGLASCGTPSDTATQSEGSSETTTGAENAPSVVASYSVLCSMVEQVAANVLKPTCLISYDQDPHTYEATPSDRQAIEQASAVFYAGLNFEPSIIQMVEATNTAAPKIAVHEKAVNNVIEVKEEGDVEPDPHIWHDVENGTRMVKLIEQTLSAKDPANAKKYASNAATMIRELEQLDTWIPKQIATIPVNQRRLVTTHDAMSYYARAYGLTVEGTLLGISTEEEPTAAQVKTLSTGIKSVGVPTVFAELTSNDKVLRTVANESGVKISDDVLIADGIGKQGTPAGSYQGMLEYNTCTIVKGLGGKCTPFE
ncbi:MAG: zinc ABC transporter substrate-binding protein [Timaviella obliquedivisa GSE-PSE-MK23-08B]|jgi:ABC-type Zn uptake system ZnuABC Zn-binding protein ZnuA|nr:zinc ABC transporter substrate-binding protein [Timaviella obliquedivisa GSE-PSE-MK23-08B]